MSLYHNHHKKSASYVLYCGYTPLASPPLSVDISPSSFFRAKNARRKTLGFNLPDTFRIVKIQNEIQPFIGPVSLSFLALKKGEGDVQRTEGEANDAVKVKS